MKKFTPAQLKKVEAALEYKATNSADPISHEAIARFFDRAYIIFQLEKLRNLNYNTLDYDVEIERMHITEDENNKLVRIKFATHVASNFLKSDCRKKIAQLIKGLREPQQTETQVQGISNLSKSIGKISPASTQQIRANNNPLATQHSFLNIKDMYEIAKKDNELTENNCLEVFGALYISKLLKQHSGFSLIKTLEQAITNP